MKALIVDDERRPAEFLNELLLRHCPEIEEIIIYNDELKALKHLNQHPVDILFSDIEMPRVNGLDLLETLPKDKRPAVIFTTAYSQYALPAFDLAATHYLLKPIDPEKLIEAVRRAVQDRMESSGISGLDLQDQMEGKLILPEGQDYHVVELKGLVRAEGAGSYTTFWLKNGEHIVLGKRLKLFEDKLKKPSFMRVHQSHIINFSYVRRYSKSDGGYIQMSDGKEVPIGSSIKSEVLEMFKSALNQ